MPDSSVHGPTAATRPSTSTTTRSAWASAARFDVAPTTVDAALPQRGPQLDLGRGVERGGDVVGQQQLGVAGESAGQRQPLHLAAGQPDSPVADQRLGSAGRLDVGGEPGGLEGRAEHPVGVVEEDVVGEGPGEHPGHLGDVGDPAGPQERLRVLDGPAVPADLAGAGDQARQRREQAGLPRADLAEEQHQLVGLDGQVDVADPDGPVVVDRGEPDQLEGAERVAGARRRRRGRAVHAGRRPAAAP